MKGICSQSAPTITHQYFKNLLQSGKVSRWYSQNIDGLEKLAGAKVEEVSEFNSKTKSKEGSVVLLHGNLENLVCVICKHKIPFTDEILDKSKKGEWYSCKACLDRTKERKEKGLRVLREGFYRPDIVLYGENHPHAETIGEIICNDFARSSGSILLVVGTSLKVIGVKKMVKDCAKKIKSLDPLSKRLFFINKTALPRTEWKTIFDYEFIGDCDFWIKLLLNEDIPKTIDLPPTNSIASPQPVKKLPSFFTNVKNSTVARLSIDKGPNTKDEKDGKNEKENITSNVLLTTYQKRTQSYIAKCKPEKVE